MASSISAGTTSSTALVATADTTGALQLATNNGTVAVTVDTSQNVGIGATVNSVFDQIAAARPLLVQEPDSSTTIAGSLASITIANSDTTTNNTAQLNFAAITGASTSQYSSAIISAIFGARTNGQYPAGQLAFSTSTALNSAPTEKIRIDSNGSLLINTTTNPGGAAKLGIKGAGTTNGTVSLYMINSASTALVLVYDDGSFYSGLAAASPYNNTTATGANAVFAANGFMQRSTSSLKYKKDVQDATHGLADVLKLRSVTYKGKNDGDIIFGGLIAEEVDAAGLNEFVQYAADGSPDALNYGNMVSLCVKAIQELTAKVTALEAKVGASA